MVQKLPFTRVEPKHLYTISRIVAQAADGKTALDEIAAFLHSCFIFDNLAVYQLDFKTEHMDVFYARAMGRGRSAEADIAWGEIMANQIIASKQTILQEPGSESGNRLERPFMLGVPLRAQGQLLGALILIRFGSPPFTGDEMTLLEFVGQQVSMLLERRNIQLELQQVEAQNQQARLQESFISTITHELRSPLGFIKGYTTTLLRSDTTWDQNTQQEFLSIIDQETDHLQELIENLLDSARLQSGQLPMVFQPVRLDGLLNDVIARAHLHHPKLRVSFEMVDNPGAIQGDPRRLAQVFENLLSNADKYAPASPVTIRIRRSGPEVYITVEDQGPGIPSQYLSHIFQRFFRNPEQTPNVHGSGLGLFICEQIIQAHNGQITVSSNVGQGTTFHIRLPLSNIPADNSKPVTEVHA